MKALVTPALALGMVAVMVGPARAQAPGSYGPGRGISGFVMSRNKSVQKELKATPEQTRKLDALFDEMLEKSRRETAQLREIPPEDLRAKSLEIQRAEDAYLRKRLAEILKPDQVKRYEQIEVQQGGINALSKPQIQAALKLNDVQKADLQATDREMAASIREAVEDLQEFQKDPQAGIARALGVRAQVLAKYIATLSDEQKAIWKNLTGEPFVIVVP
jgi:Spy/CpxP family protein refolding chaperone